MTGGADVSGSAASVDATVATQLRALPVWFFQGSNDPNVSVGGTRLLVQAFQAVGAPVRYTEYAGAGHDVWDQAFATAELYSWVFAQHR